MENTVLRALLERRSIRSYQLGQIKEEELDAVLQAGTYAPTAKGAQSPLIVAVQDPATISKLSQMNREIMGAEHDTYYGAPTILLVFADGEMPTFVEDGSCVLMQMMVACHALGLGSCWINRERQMFDSKEGKALMRLWGVDEKHKGVGALAVGYPDGERPSPAPRKNGYIVKV